LSKADAVASMTISRFEPKTGPASPVIFPFDAFASSFSQFKPKQTVQNRHIRFTRQILIAGRNLDRISIVRNRRDWNFKVELVAKLGIKSWDDVHTDPSIPRNSQQFAK